ncbi:MAG: carboxymuconolactone decarboxylase family protein [Planctomycetes bacterium]|nr:carboxymuconolactone decarboxylase family protein [Planctomycetota bacterium]
MDADESKKKRDAKPAAAPADETAADGRAAPKAVKSYALVEPEIMRPYMHFYKATYERGHLDRKTKELIAIAASLVSGCKGCLEGHLKKAVKFGATRGEISETIAVTLGVNAAAIVDRSDLAAAATGISIDDLPSEPPKYADEKH